MEQKTKKSSLRIETYGTIDELSSHIGLLLEYVKTIEPKPNIDQTDLKTNLSKIQNKLFCLSSEIASTNNNLADNILIKAPDILELEKQIDFMSECLPALKNFILPGGSISSAQAHICRCVCRKSERKIVELSEKEGLRSDLIIYLNRLSDLFFLR